MSRSVARVQNERGKLQVAVAEQMAVTVVGINVRPLVYSVVYNAAEPNGTTNGSGGNQNEPNHPVNQQLVNVCTCGSERKRTKKRKAVQENVAEVVEMGSCMVVKW